MIVIHLHSDNEIYDVTEIKDTDVLGFIVNPDVPGIIDINMPKGDTVWLAKSLADVKAKFPKAPKALLEGLFNACLIDTDDKGNYLF